MIKLSSIKTNPDNPRIIRDARFADLKKSLDEFPEMMELRPIVVDENWMVLGGNMRLRALMDLGHTMIANKWVKQVKGWTRDRKREFTAKDNASFGEWDWEKLAAEWGDAPLADWGIDVPKEWAEDPADFKEYDESVEAEVKFIECPECHHRFPQ